MSLRNTMIYGAGMMLVQPLAELWPAMLQDRKAQVWRNFSVPHSLQYHARQYRQMLVCNQKGTCFGACRNWSAAPPSKPSAEQATLAAPGVNWPASQTALQRPRRKMSRRPYSYPGPA